MITRQVEIIAPQGCKVQGFLYESDSKYEQSQDMLDVSLPNGILIIAGWFPDGDPNGKYRVSVFRGYNEIIPSSERLDIDEAARDVNVRIEGFFGRNLVALASDSDTQSATIESVA
jgi:hypothetical protein